jgi:hypothetical protein
MIKKERLYLKQDKAISQLLNDQLVEGILMAKIY